MSVQQSSSTQKGGFWFGPGRGWSVILMVMSPCTCCFKGQRGAMEAVDDPCLTGERLTAKNRKNQVVCNG